jgi:hypothetical protein
MFLKYVSCLVNRSCKSYIVSRGIRQVSNVGINNQNTEIEIDVPWGKIRGMK